MLLHSFQAIGHPKTKASEFLTRSREILRISLPITLQSAAASLMSLTDLLMVKHLGTASVAAVGIISRWQIVFILLVGSIGTANAILTSQLFGAKDIHACKNLFIRSLLLGTAFAILISALFYIFRFNLVQFSTNDPETIALANIYLVSSLPLFILTHCVIVLESSIRSTGDSKTPFALSVVAIGINALFSYVLIFGKLGFPKLDIAGAAFGIVAARLVHLALLILHIKIKRHWLWLGAFSIGILSDWIAYIKFIIPITLSIALWALGTLFYTLCFSNVSANAAAVYSLVMCLDGLLFAIFYGISAGAGVLIGHELGAGRDAGRIAAAALFIGCVLSALVCACVFGFKDVIASFLMAGDSAAHLELTNLLIVMSTLFWIRALNVILINGFLRAGGDNRHCVFIDVTSAWFIGIPILLILQHAFDLPLYVLFAGVFIEELVKLMLACRRYLSGKWVKNLTSGLHS